MAHILVVDDQKSYCHLLEDELTEAGHVMRSVHDAENVAELLHGCPVDMVLLDLFLNGLEGWKVLETIKAEKPRLPVVILTAYDSFRDDPRLAKAAAYVIKNFDLGELKQTIARVFDNSRVLETSKEPEPRRIGCFDGAHSS